MWLKKEVGDLYNWTTVIEEDLIKVVEKKQASSASAAKK